MSNPPSEPLDVEAIKAKLEALKSEHRDLDEVIDRLLEKPPFDQLQLQRLKKRKLGLEGSDPQAGKQTDSRYHRLRREWPNPPPNAGRPANRRSA